MDPLVASRRMALDRVLGKQPIFKLLNSLQQRSNLAGGAAEDNFPLGEATRPLP